jgi:hypothetical protein
MGERTERDDDKIRVSDILIIDQKICGNAFMECTSRAKKKIETKYMEDFPEEEDRSRDALFKLFDEIDIPMKMDEKNRRHFICNRCGLYATREEVSDIRFKLNQRERTRDDKHDDYLEWWSKSKKDKELN